MAWPSYYTNNFCPNPSVEVSTTGYAAIKGTEQVTQDSIGYAGRSSLKVVTPGSSPGEGISTPAGSIIASVTGSASVSIYGETGFLTVQAVQNGGQVLLSVPVQLDGNGWQRVDLNGLAMTNGDTFQLLVFTTVTQPITFWVDAVQYEPESPAHPYIDGDSPYCTWTGTQGLSASYQQYQFPVSLTGSMILEGTISVLAHGEVFTTGVISGMMDMSGQQHQMVAVSSPSHTVVSPAIDPDVAGMPWLIAGYGTITSVLVVNPGSGLSDFAIFASTDPDPAMTLIGPNNAGTQNANSSATGYTRLYGMFTPPQQSLDSAGNARWQAAAYMAAGFRIASQAAWASGAPNSVNFTQIQVEKATANTPAAYQLPRALSTIVKPTRMNFVTNPSMEVSIAGWTAFGGATLTQVSGGFQGTHSLQVSVPSTNSGVYIMIPDLILGDTYVASAYIEPVSSNIVDVTMSADGTQVSSNPTGYPYGAGGFGSGPYGGVEANAAAMTTGAWSYRPWASFVASQSTVMLSFFPFITSGGTYPLVFNIDCVLVEPGEILQAYGDGNTDDWAWELGGTPGLCRSYFYDRESAGVDAVSSVLGQHIPLGVSAYEPQYFVPPTQ